MAITSGQIIKASDMSNIGGSSFSYIGASTVYDELRKNNRTINAAQIIFSNEPYTDSDIISCMTINSSICLIDGYLNTLQSISFNTGYLTLDIPLSFVGCNINCADLNIDSECEFTGLQYMLTE